VYRAAWLNQASTLLVGGRKSERALQAMEQLTRLDATIAALEQETEDTRTHDLEPDLYLMTIRELLPTLGSDENYKVEGVFKEILTRAAHGSRQPVVYNALWIALGELRHRYRDSADELAEAIIDNIGGIAIDLLERDDRRRQLDDDEDALDGEPLSPETRRKLEAARAACAEKGTIVAGGHWSAERGMERLRERAAQ
jgi:hypothetical protein